MSRSSCACVQSVAHKDSARDVLDYNREHHSQKANVLSTHAQQYCTIKGLPILDFQPRFKWPGCRNRVAGVFGFSSAGNCTLTVAHFIISVCPLATHPDSLDILCAFVLPPRLDLYAPRAIAPTLLRTRHRQAHLRLRYHTATASTHSATLYRNLNVPAPARSWNRLSKTPRASASTFPGIATVVAPYAATCSVYDLTCIHNTIIHRS